MEQNRQGSFEDYGSCKLAWMHKAERDLKLACQSRPPARPDHSRV